MPTSTIRLLPLLTLCALASACGPGSDSKAPAPDAPPSDATPAAVPSSAEQSAPAVENGRILLPPPGAPMAAAYFEVRNAGPDAIVLRAVRSTSFDSVEMHETREEDGMSRMRQLDKVQIPAGSTVIFEPGGKHLMLMGSKLDAEHPVQDLPMQLDFVGADGATTSIDVPFKVEAATEGAAESHH